MSSPVRYEREGDVAAITVANPPVNALSHAVRQALKDAFDKFEADAAARIAVLVGEGRLFIGGADISEFGKPRLGPSLPEVINQMEASAKPIVAAIHGAALGGGLEVALGAHYRLALEGSALGLPETTLGLIPGAGGTQRMARLVGAELALELIPAGARIAPQRALAAGLIDRLEEGRDAKAAGLAYAAELLTSGAPPRPISAMAAPKADPELFSRARELASRKRRGEPAPAAAIDAIEAATRLPFSEGLAEERRIFLEMEKTPQREALVHAFFAERAAARLPALAGAKPRDVETVGVVGGGTMGSGIATACLLSGLAVILVERDAPAAEKARAAIAANLEAAIKRGKLSAEARETILAERLHTATDFDVLAGADLIVEAVFEDMDVKKEVFRELDRVARPGAVLATNTSYLDVDEIAAATGRPADVIGLHFFSPAHVMKLLETVVAARTAADVQATASAFARRLGKIAVRARVCDGFIGNRLLARCRTTADGMVLVGASPYQIDAALTEFGFAMGPYAVSDLAGLDIGYMTRQRKVATRDPGDPYPSWADELYRLGRLGQKTGRGYYLYEAGSRKAAPDPEVETLVAKARREAGAAPRDFGAEEIQTRYMAAMVNEAARILEEGVAERPRDIDLTLLHGYGFPRWRGGPMKWADMLGLGRLVEAIGYFSAEDSRQWRVAPLLERLAAEGLSFDSLNSAEGDAP